VFFRKLFSNKYTVVKRRGLKKMTNSRFLLSIIIPTRNRQEYAIKAIEQILHIDDERIQIVVQDNSDTTMLFEMIAAYKDDIRLKYNHTKDVMSFVDNFSVAVSLSDGDYVCIIGDDDGIMPQISGVTEWAKKNNIDAIKPELNAVFFWPQSEAIGNEIDNGYMMINKITAKARLCNPFNEVMLLLKNGGQKYLALDMVKLYHGIVKKECLEKIKEQTGRYFGGLSPDIYAAVALSLTVTKAVKIDFPLTISGVCNKSGSSDSATGRHTGKLENAPHFRGHAKYEWSKFVPQFYSVETIWADTALAAINDLKKNELLKKFNISAISVCCLRKYPQFRDIIRANYIKNNINKLMIAKAYMSMPFEGVFRKILRKLSRIKGRTIYLYNIPNITDAKDALSNNLANNGIDMEHLMNELNRIET